MELKLTRVKASCFKHVSMAQYLGALAQSDALIQQVF